MDWTVTEAALIALVFINLATSLCVISATVDINKLWKLMRDQDKESEPDT